MQFHVPGGIPVDNMACLGHHLDDFLLHLCRVRRRGREEGSSEVSLLLRIPLGHFV